MRAERDEERERVMNPRPILLRLPTAEKEFLMPGGYEVVQGDDGGLFRLNKRGEIDLLVTYSPAFVIEYLAVKEPIPRLMAKIAFKRYDGWKVVAAAITNGFTPTFLFKIVDYGLMSHSGNIHRLCRFLKAFAELNKDAISLTVVDNAPPIIVETTHGGTDG
jgi:hypothetical protein